MEGAIDLNILGLTTQSLLCVLIVVLLLQCYGVLKCQEGMSSVSYDKYKAGHNQEGDSYLAAAGGNRSILQRQQDDILE